MAELGETQKAATKKYALDQTEVEKINVSDRATVLGRTMHASRKKYQIFQEENIVPGSAKPSNVVVERKN